MTFFMSSLKLTDDKYDDLFSPLIYDLFLVQQTVDHFFAYFNVVHVYF